MAKILVVEDEPGPRELISRRLSGKGYEVSTAQDGEEALHKLKREPFDLILLDIRMPGMSGMDVLAPMKSLYPDVGVIMATAVVDLKVALDTIRAGAYDYVTKPFDWDEVLISVERALERRRLVLENRAYQRSLEGKVREKTEALRRANQYLQSLLENANDIIYTVDPEGRFTFLNRRIEDLGYNREELIGRPLLSILTEKHQGRRTKKTLEEGTRQVYEVEVKDKDGHIRHTVFSTSPLRDENGAVTAVLGIIRDVTEQRRLQQQLIRSDKLASVGQLTAGVAHEINTPLNVLYGHLELLLLEKEGDPDLFRTLKGMQEQVSKIIEITRNLLDFSRQREPQKTPVDLNDLLERTLSLVEHEMSVEDIVVVSAFDPVLPSLWADGDQLAQVFLNMITNARDAMPEGGELTLRTSTSRLRSRHASGETIEIRFMDTGRGISEEHLGKIFDPFFTTKPAGEGTGLGLSVSYGIIQAHGGTIEVESEVGRGTTFTIRLPVVRDRGEQGKERQKLKVKS